MPQVDLIRGNRYLLRSQPVIFEGLGDDFAQRPTFTPVGGGPTIVLSGLQAFALMATDQLTADPPAMTFGDGYPSDGEIEAEEAHEAWKEDAVQCNCGAVLDNDHAWDIHLSVHRSPGDGSDEHYQL